MRSALCFPLRERFDETRGNANETSRIPEGGGPRLAASAVAAPAIAQSMPEINGGWPRAGRSRSTRSMAAASIFAKRVAEITDNKFQIQVFAAGEIVPGLQVLDAVQNGTVEMRPHRAVLLLRQGPGLRLRHRAAVRPQRAPDERLAALRRRQRAAQRVLKNYNVHRLPGRQHRRADGRLVPQGDQDASTTSRASRCASAASPAASCRSSAWCRSRSPAGDIYPALEKGTIDAAEWVGPYDDEKLGFYKVAQLLLLSGLVGRLRPGAQHHQHRQVERAAEELPGGR